MKITTLLFLVLFGTSTFASNDKRFSMDGKDLSALLIGSGHARPYDGGKHLSWCD